MNGPRDIKDRELPRLPPGCQAILRRTVEAVINHTAVLKALETGGSALRLIATRRRLWWSFSRPSSAWLFRSMKENYSPLGLANISSPSGFTLLFVACVCMCQQPDNSRIPTRTAAVPENLAHPLGYFPTEKRVRIGYSPSVFGCANPGQRYVYAHLTRPPFFCFLVNGRPQTPWRCCGERAPPVVCELSANVFKESGAFFSFRGCRSPLWCHLERPKGRSDSDFFFLFCFVLFAQFIVWASFSALRAIHSKKQQKRQLTEVGTVVLRMHAFSHSVTTLGYMDKRR